VDVRVTEGVVKVKHARQELPVAAGNAWTTSHGLLAIGELEARLAAAVVATAVPDPDPDPDPIQIAVNDPPSALRDRQAAVPEAAPVRRTVPARSRVEPAPVLGERIVRDRPLPRLPSDPHVELRTAIKKQPLPHDPKIDGKQNAAEARKSLYKVAFSNQTVGAEASIALYQIAVLLHRPLEQDGEALRTIDLYLRRFTTGNERAAVLWLRTRILCLQALDDRCRQAADAYERAFSGGDAASLALRIRNAP
jgi:hypothetical protein